MYNENRTLTKREINFIMNDSNRVFEAEWELLWNKYEHFQEVSPSEPCDNKRCQYCGGRDA